VILLLPLCGVNLTNKCIQQRQTAGWRAEVARKANVWDFGTGFYTAQCRADIDDGVKAVKGKENRRQTLSAVRHSPDWRLTHTMMIMHITHLISHHLTSFHLNCMSP